MLNVFIDHSIDVGWVGHLTLHQALFLIHLVYLHFCGLTNQDLGHFCILLAYSHFGGGNNWILLLLFVQIYLTHHHSVCIGNTFWFVKWLLTTKLCHRSRVGVWVLLYLQRNIYLCYLMRHTQVLPLANCWHRHWYLNFLCGWRPRLLLLLNQLLKMLRNDAGDTFILICSALINLHMNV